MKSKIKFLKRLLEPAFLNKREALKSMIEPAYSSFWFQTFPIFTLPILTTAINQGDSNKIIQLAYLVLFAYFVFWFIQWFMRSWFWSGTYSFEASLEEKYRAIILKKDQSELDLIGTGKLQSIITSGIFNWAYMANYSMWFTVRGLLNLSFGIYFSISLGVNYFIFYIVILSIVFYIIPILLRKKMIYDKMTTETENEKNKFTVRSIMSRNEILLSGKIQKEADLLRDFSLQKVVTEIKSANYYFWAEKVTLSVGTFLPFIGAAIFVANNDLNPINVAILISFVFFSMRLNDVIWEFWGFVKSSFNNFPKVKLLWNFLDDVPTIKGYDEGEQFVHKGGEIELRNINFSYEAKSAKI
jgi:ABC-type multidrug transport system fused ATPase/permease subunit